MKDCILSCSGVTFPNNSKKKKKNNPRLMLLMRWQADWPLSGLNADDHSWLRVWWLSFSGFTHNLRGGIVGLDLQVILPVLKLRGIWAKICTESWASHFRTVCFVPQNILKYSKSFFLVLSFVLSYLLSDSCLFVPICLLTTDSFKNQF